MTNSLPLAFDLLPKEIVEYVDALSGYDEFLGALSQLDDPREALAQVSNRKIRARVEKYNEWANGTGLEFCFAAFMGGELEGLMCSIVEGRHEILGVRYTGDRRFLLREALELLPSAVSAAKEHGGEEFAPRNEAHLRSLVFLVLKCLFPDARTEEYTPQHAGTSSRIDRVFPSISVVLEIKLVRDKQHARKVASELKVDIESYHAHQNCKKLVAYVWDPQFLLPDRENFKTDLRGQRTKAGRTFGVEVLVKP